MSEIHQQTNKRKVEHLEAFSKDPEIERKGSGFDRIKLTHRAIVEISYDEIDTSCSFCGKDFSFPLIISSMTGGSDPETKRINRNIALAAEEQGIGFAVGSQRILFEDQESEESFALREFAPNVFIGANLGAVQFNYDFGLKECIRAINVSGADALFIHFNPLQEAVQVEGNRNFAGLIDKITKLRQAIQKPLIIKEIGCGLSLADIELAHKRGFGIFDVAGQGGTSWARVEYSRRTDPQDNIGMIFQDWGIPTVQALDDACQSFPQCRFIASGGIRSGLDIAKAIILGAEMTASAAPFLAAARISSKAVGAKIRRWKRELQTAMFVLSCKKITELHGNRKLIVSK